MAQLESLLNQIQAVNDRKTMFAEPQQPIFDNSWFSLGPQEPQPQFQEGFRGKLSGFMSVRGSALFIVLGLVLATTIGDYVQSVIPGSLAQYSTALAGVLLVVLARNSYTLKSFGFGVFLAGVAEIVKGFSMFSKFKEPNMYAETKETFGGTDGTYPVQPDRQVFA